MAHERFAEHLQHPTGRGRAVPGGHDGSAGGAACGDLIRVSIAVEGETVVGAGFEASGCGAIVAAGSAAVALVQGRPVLEAARVSAGTVSAELGGLSAGKFHAADLAADALHRALGLAIAADCRLAPDPRRTLVAMSGGVDSAVAALLVGQEGEAVAVTLELWRDPENDADGSCCSASAVRTARGLAHRMGLAHVTIDLRDAFRAGVVDPWLAGHAAGETPNPCVRCNGSVRLDAMVALADRLGAAHLATGHYARIDEQGLLRSAADPDKDQTYMLAALSPRTIARLRFPLGELDKPRVRQLARLHELPVAERPDSQDLCFLAGTGRERFLARHGRLAAREGEIVDRAGERVGRHRGAHGFTVGQRRGLGVGGRVDPLYVLETDVRSNRVVVGTRDELATTTVRLRDVELHLPPGRVDRVRLRYRSPAVECSIRDDVLHLKTPFEGAAPGQTAVLLSGDLVAGSATIET